MAKYDYTVDGEMVRPTKMDVVVPMTVVNPNDNQTYRVTALGDGAFTVYGLRGGLVRLHVDSSSGGFA